jgi:hypothetical protein
MIDSTPTPERLDELYACAVARAGVAPRAVRAAMQVIVRGSVHRLPGLCGELDGTSNELHSLAAHLQRAGDLAFWPSCE